ncbi:Flp pilus assembly protein CpaB [Kerstersia similis]|uniref:Flp pilus assembly protein CpaB n=1 Tax=Kerstersia similis TaxID=206505 RepID=UPI0039EF4D2D
MSNLSKIAAVVLIALAVILGLFAFKLSRESAPVVPVSAPIVAAPAEQAPPPPQYPVLVAARQLVAGQPLRAEDLTVEQWQAQPAASFDKPEAVIGELLRFDVAPGEPVTSQALMRGLSRYLKEGERAVTLAVDEQSGPAAHIVPGDLVDIFLTFNKSGEIGGTQSRLLQSRQRVLAYGIDSVDGPPQREPLPDEKEAGKGPRASAGSGAGGNGRAPRNSVNNTAPRTAVLAIPVDQVNELLLASRNGKLQLVLRSPEDEAKPDPALFPERQLLLAGRPDLKPEEKELLKQGENRAYAGESLLQLSGPEPEKVEKPEEKKKQQVRAAQAAQAPVRSIEVVRGSQREQVRY